MANVYEAAIAPVGHVEPSGLVYRGDGTLAGVVAADGRVSAQGAQVVEYADASGRCSDLLGQVVGTVQHHSGGVFDGGGRYRGYVAEGAVPLQLMAGAALFLLLLHPI